MVAAICNTAPQSTRAATAQTTGPWPAKCVQNGVNTDEKGGKTIEAYDCRQVQNKNRPSPGNVPQGRTRNIQRLDQLKQVLCRNGSKREQSDAEAGLFLGKPQLRLVSSWANHKHTRRTFDLQYTFQSPRSCNLPGTSPSPKARRHARGKTR